MATLLSPLPPPPPSPPSASPAFVQVNAATPQTPQSTVTVPYLAAQAGGNLNVVVVGWNDTVASVIAVTDTAGNAYALAVGPMVFTGKLTQSIYYAKNIAGGANSVTVRFSTAAIYADIRILEYSGIDAVNPVDVTAAGSGNSNASSSGAVTTTNASDLLVGANTVFTSTTGPGSGYTRRVITTPDGDIAEDQLVTATGPYAATAPLSSSGPWVMQMVAFRAAALGLTVTPRVAALTSTRTQQFTASATGVAWSVNGIAGGSASVGTITATGLYTPPATVGAYMVTATSTGNPPETGTATVYVTDYPGIFTYHNDNMRTGQNTNETVLSLANVNATQFGKLFSYPLDGIPYASPVYVANVDIPGQGFHNVVYIATEHDSVYAFDADGLSPTPLWHVSFINPGAGVTTVPAADTGECCDIAPEIGITGTPVIDAGTGTLYVVVKTKEISGSTTNYVQRLHALDIATGAEKFGGPVALQAVVPGTGTGTDGSGQVAFIPLIENQREALLLNNGVIYIAFASHGDNGPYHGWVLGYDAATLSQVLAFNDTPNGAEGGIWQSGFGPAADSNNNVYFVSGNGTFDANTGGVDFGDSFIKLAPNGAVLDYFTPYDQSSLETFNLDLGAGGSPLLPDQPGPHPHLLIGAGKTGTIYLLDRDNMGHFNPAGDTQIVQSIVNAFPNGVGEPGNFSAPVVWQDLVYFGPVGDTIQAFQLTNGLLTTAPISQSAIPYAFPGATLSVSANGTSDAILWAIERPSASTPGVLHAYDASDLSRELYNSGLAGSRDVMDIAAKFSIPTVANGKVFVGAKSQLIVFGLLP